MTWIFLFLLTLFIRPQDWLGSPVYGWPLNDIIVIGGLLQGMANRDRLRSALALPQSWLIGALMVLAFTSNAANGSVAGGTQQFMLFLKRFAVYLLFLLNVDNPRKIGQVFFFSMLMTVVLSFQGMSQNAHGGIGWAHQVLHTSGGGIERAAAREAAIYGNRTFWIGLWDGPNVLCLAYLMPVPFCLDMILRRNNDGLTRVFGVLCFLLIAVGIYQTNSRGGFLSLGAVILIFTAVRFGVKKGLILALLLFPVYLAASPKRMANMTSEEASAHERTWLWERGLNMMESNVLFGIGKGQFAKRSGLVAHNNYVSSMAETGLPGLLVYIALLYVSLKGAYLAYDALKGSRDNPELYHVAVIAAIATAGFYLATFFVLMEHDILYMYWALCGAVYLALKSGKKEAALRLRKKDWMAISAMTAGVLFLVWLVAEKEII